MIVDYVVGIQKADADAGVQKRNVAATRLNIIYSPRRRSCRESIARRNIRLRNRRVFDSIQLEVVTRDRMDRLTKKQAEGDGGWPVANPKCRRRMTGNPSQCRSRRTITRRRQSVGLRFYGDRKIINVAD